MATPGLLTKQAVHVAAVKGQNTTPAALAVAASVNTFRFGVFEGGSMGYVKGIVLDGPFTDVVGVSTPGRHMTPGLFKNTTEGNPAQPSLQLNYPGSFWRFRWSVQAGSRLIQVNVKQVNNGTARPTMVVKAAAGILASDQTVTAGSSTGWIAMSVSFTALSTGALWVELHNNDFGIARANGQTVAINPCYFDHLVAT